jgi:hypothetical protein
MDTLQDALVTAFKGAGDNTSDTAPGQHANPYSPPAPPAPPNPPPEPPNKSPFPPEPTVEQNRADFEKALRNDVAGDEGDARRRYYDSVEREMRSRDMQEDIIGKTKGATKYLFSEWTSDKFNPLDPSTYFGKNERSIMSAINKTIEDAAKSGDPVQFNSAKELQEGLSRYGIDEKTGKKYNEENTFNVLAEFKDNIIKMLDKFKEVSDSLENAAGEINKAEINVFGNN